MYNASPVRMGPTTQCLLLLWQTLFRALYMFMGLLKRRHQYKDIQTRLYKSGTKLPPSVHDIKRPRQLSSTNRGIHQTNMTCVDIWHCDTGQWGQPHVLVSHSACSEKNLPITFTIASPPAIFPVDIPENYATPIKRKVGCFIHILFSHDRVIIDQLSKIMQAIMLGPNTGNL